MNDSLDNLKKECFDSHGVGYSKKMLHPVPVSLVVEREKYIQEYCRDKVVLSLGHTGLMADIVDEVSAKCYAMDKLELAHPNFTWMDLDNVPNRMPGQSWGVEVVLMGEVLEHLTNPGRLLQACHTYHCPILITVPNAFGAAGWKHMQVGVENVNAEHVAYYSYWTLKRLVETCGYKVDSWYWYKGKPLTAEGLVFLVSKG